MDTKEQQKLYILFGIFAIAGLVAYFNLLLKPQVSRFIANNGDYQVIRSRVKDAEVLIANEARIKAQYENLRKEARLLERRFPRQDEISSLLEDFSGIAESSGVRILRIKPLEVPGSVSQDAAGGGLYSRFPILVEARAGYHQCGRFFNELESMARFIAIEQIDIRQGPQDPRHHDIRLRVVTYVIGDGG